MARPILFAIIMSVLVLSSCDISQVSSNGLNDGVFEEKQLLFFSDDKNIDREAVYYDALLDLQKEFPEKVDNMKVIAAKQEYGPFEVDTYPSLLVIDEQQIIVHIEGSVLSKDEITKPILEALSD
ncbi:hypothetical protein ACFFIX_25385 [Metabacillus herbersteinensis]|uniref:Small peptidoglycan-associated lipoprotein n=1 Tax=Metabacillus herbersteinensis TaxID=283816 RepID=A0ABV6GMJ2_9BACI